MKEQQQRAQETPTQGSAGEAEPELAEVLADDGWAERYAPHGTRADVRPKRSFLDVVFGFFGKKPEPLAAQALPPPGEDPVRRILAMPRGAARLDAFEETLAELPPGSPGHRGVALAFHRELTTLAKNAKLDLALLKRRVEACAEALLAAGDVERAGLLLSQIGRKRRAAELFVAAGLIDELEEAHSAIDQDAGGAHLSARLAYERFEGLFVVGMRAEALEALESAIASWPENPVYQEIARGFRGRVQAGTVELEVEGGGARRRFVITRRFPLVVGRGEQAALRLASPLISREHLEIALEGGRPLLRNLQERPVTLDGAPLDRPRELVGEGTLEASGVTLRYEREGALLWLWSEQQPERRTVALLEREAELPLDEKGRSLRLSFDERERATALPTEGLRLTDEPVQRPLLLLEGDRLSLGGLFVRVLAR